MLFTDANPLGVVLACALTAVLVLSGCVRDSTTPDLATSDKQAAAPSVANSSDSSPAIPGGSNSDQVANPAANAGTGGDHDPAAADDRGMDRVEDGNQFDGGRPQPPAEPTIEIPEHWKRLSKEEEIWIDMRDKQVIIGGTVCLNSGPLEMFICPAGTKEHESVMAARVLALQVHTALMALGANPGKPASWNPEYRPAYGPMIEIEMRWRDPETDKETSTSARQWIRNASTGKAMESNWVFGGSEIYEDLDTGQRMYLGESGELVCLSNFSTATIDLNVKSSQDNYDLMFEAFTENVPPVGTQVYALIRPGKVIGLPESPSEPAADSGSTNSKAPPTTPSPATEPAGTTGSDGGQEP